ncbi:MAG: hypothetical protein HY840_05010 [Bacteroidetes bacterium]|nr:hypothetical protein [Bacteroidota bacterium]
MDISIPYYFFRLFEKDTTSFIYQGTFSDDLTDKTIRLGEHSIRNITEFNRIRKRVSFLIAECLQNVIRYEEKPKVLHQTNNRPGTFMVRNINHAYYIISSNLIKNEKVGELKIKLKKINDLDKEELKKMQQKVLSDPVFSEKGGAGLGMIEMTRKSGHKLEYDFEFVNSYLSSFYLQVKLTANEETDATRSLLLNNAKDIYHEILDKKITILYKGDFSQQSMLPVLGMIESNLKKNTEQYNSRKKVFYLLVELLQNMSKHALEQNGLRQGILVICNKNQKHYIYCGNFIDIPKEEKLNIYLEKISNLDKEQLATLYKEHLFDGRIRPKGGAGLGLIDMMRYSEDKPVFNFHPYNATSSFFSLGFSI